MRLLGGTPSCVIMETSEISRETLANEIGLHSNGRIQESDLPSVIQSLLAGGPEHAIVIYRRQSSRKFRAFCPNENAQVHTQTYDKLIGSIQRSLERLDVSGCVVRDIQDGTALLHCPGIDKNEERIIQVAIRVLPTITAVKIDTKKTPKSLKVAG